MTFLHLFSWHLLGRVTTLWDHNDPVYPVNSWFTQIANTRSYKTIKFVIIFPQVAHNSMRIPRVFHVQRNPRVFKVFQVCGHTDIMIKQKVKYSTSSMFRNSTPSTFGFEAGQRLPWRACRVATAPSTVSYWNIVILYEHISGTHATNIMILQSAANCKSANNCAKY